jgi:cell division protein FtsA
MEELNYIVALEIGTSKICAAAATVESEGRIKIKSFLEKKIDPKDEILRNGYIDSVQNTIVIIDQLLQETADELGIDLQDVNVNISNPQIKGQTHGGTLTRNSSSKQVEQADVDKLVDDVKNSFKLKPDRSILHHTPLDFYVNDIKAKERIEGKVGSQISGDFYFLTTPKESLENLYYAVNKVNAKFEEPGSETMNISHIIASPIADAFALLDHSIDDKRNGVAIVNIGADLTEVAVFHSNSLRYFKTIGIAGNAITKDLCDTFNLNYEEGEKLKKLCGLLPSDMVPQNEVVTIERSHGLAPIEILLKNAVLITEWRLKEIAALVKVELLNSGYDKNLVNGLILTGGSANFNSLKDIFTEILKIKNIRRPSYSKNIDFEDYNYLKKPQFSTLLGLLLVQNNDFDARVTNKVLKHSPVPMPEKPEPKPQQVKTQKKAEPAKNKIGTFFKNLLKEDNMNDTFQN